MARVTASTRKEQASLDVRTLHPEKLTPEDYISLKAARREISGFLYYWSPPSHITPLAGEVRFRQTASSDPSSFAQGKGYHLRLGMPWSIPLFKISFVEGSRPWRDVLLRDGLVSVETMKSAQHKRRQWTKLHRVVHSLYQPFVISLSQHKHIFNFLGWQGLHQCTFWNLCNAKGAFYRHWAQPFIASERPGIIVSCFEPSQLPKHAGTRTIIMRILEVAPIDYRTRSGRSRCIPLPTEGELLPTFVYWPVEGTPEYDGTKTDMDRPKEDWWAPWSVNVDQTYYMGDMRVLFESQDPLGLPKKDMWMLHLAR
ncbi:hypothetical protein TRAPUB_4898 [Trametes pubescens]|uniref:Uncharacterized protein n=1 Tax=Trametes pubescens TaxID=154538 RepID=A0A1M2VA36_TRAPU|nr:hypothetical protein TRAPUB_4898 [Trametes pubescens]